MIIRRAAVNDLDSIRRIQSLSPECAQWSVEEYLAQDCTVAERDGAVVGYLVSRDLSGEREILDVAVDAASRRHGIGRSLVQNEIQAKADAWFLEVRESNTAARKLYFEVGFREVGKRPGYYQDPSESAIVMRFLS